MAQHAFHTLEKNKTGGDGMILAIGREKVVSVAN